METLKDRVGECVRYVVGKHGLPDDRKDGSSKEFESHKEYNPFDKLMLDINKERLDQKLSTATAKAALNQKADDFTNALLFVEDQHLPPLIDTDIDLFVDPTRPQKKKKSVKNAPQAYRSSTNQLSDALLKVVNGDPDEKARLNKERKKKEKREQERREAYMEDMALQKEERRLKIELLKKQTDAL